MYTMVAAWATFATPLPMWGVEGSRMVLLPNMMTDFRDTRSPRCLGVVEQDTREAFPPWDHA